jgi:hypothetical protein
VETSLSLIFSASQANISQNIEIPETQQSVAPLPSASQDKETKSRPRKRKVSSARDNEGLEHPKRNKVQDVPGIPSVCENQPGVDTGTFVGLLNKILAHKEELKKANEKIEKNRQNIEMLFLTNNILLQRLARAENLIQDLNRKYSRTIQSLRADLNSMNGQIRTIKTDRDNTIAALTKMVNNYIIPGDASLLNS